MARLDSVLVVMKIVSGRERAKEMIASGVVTVNGKTVKKASFNVSDDDIVECSEKQKYVGRGALKLEKAAFAFGLSFVGKKCLDIGASTGGFTDFMLQNGAFCVYAADVGSGQLAEKLRIDERVVCMENTDIRSVSPDDIGGEADFICADVSFISLKMILPKLYELLKDGEYGVVLIKPQFEAGRSNIGKNGIVKNRKVHISVLADIDAFAASLGFIPKKYTFSPVKGGSGNIEYLALLQKNAGERHIFDFKDLTDQAFEQL